jgi:NADH dehydrogenase
MTAIPGEKLVTIFGGSGFLGRHLVRALANDGWRIRVAVRHPNTAHFLKPMGRVGQIQLMKANVLKDEDVAAATEGADAVINLVGAFKNFQALQVGAPKRIAERAEAAGISRLIHVSVIGASGEAPAKYFRSKAEGEAELLKAYPAATIVRPSLMFGPEDGFFNRFAALVRMLPFAFPLFGGGKTQFQPVFVGDVANGIARLLRDPSTAGGIFEFAGPEVMSFRDVMEFVLRHTGRKRSLVSVPLPLASLKAFFLQILPNAPLTPDQVRMFRTDTIASGEYPGLRELGILPSAAEAIVPSYLWRFRKRGQFEAVTAP